MADVLYPSKALLDAFLKSLLSEVASFSFKQKGYVAPTVFLLKGKTYGTGMNYYASMAEAVDKIKYLFHQGGANSRPAGSVPLRKDGTAQTIGLNVDFYFMANPNSYVNLGYKALKYSVENTSDNIFSIFRFFKTDGTGPYFGIFDPKVMGASATVVSSYSSDKIDALDRFHREVVLLKSRHNTLAAFLNNLASKQLTPVQQQVFNEGSLHLQTMRSEMATIQGLEIYYSKDGRIGFIAIPLIGWLIIGAIAAGWAVSKIVEQYQKTARLNSSYDIQKWVAEQKLKIAQELSKGTITPAAAAQLTADLTQVSKQAGENAATASAPSQSMFGEIGEIVKWAAIGLGVYAISNAISSSNSSNKKSS